MRLLCLPHAGGSASPTTPGERLRRRRRGAGDPVPGRQERIAEPCLESMEELADAVTAAVLPLLDKPLALFGHSMGPLAYEVAVRLERRHGFCPSVLLVSGQRPPTGSGRAPRTWTVPSPFSPRSASWAVPTPRCWRTPTCGNSRCRRSWPTSPSSGGMPRRAPARRARALPGHRLRGKPRSQRHRGRGGRLAGVAPKGFELKVLEGDHFYLASRRDELVADLTSRLR
ncbi:thioesterase II family protein [Streptomyces sp. INA 01156]